MTRSQPARSELVVEALELLTRGVWVGPSEPFHDHQFAMIYVQRLDKARALLAEAVGDLAAQIDAEKTLRYRERRHGWSPDENPMPPYERFPWRPKDA